LGLFPHGRDLFRRWIVLLAGGGVLLAVLGAGIEGDLSTTVLATGLVLLGIVVVLFGVRPRRHESGLQ
jgi:hypothetical protein